MNKREFFFFAALAVVISCAKETGYQEESEIVSSVEMVFTASRDAETQTRTSRQENGNIWWSPADEIKIFNGAVSSGKFTAQNTETAATATFRGSLDAATGSIEGGSGSIGFMALYPFEEDATCDGASITFTLPSVQTGADDPFGNGTFPAIAHSNDLNLAFYNVCGGVKFSVSSEGILSVTFKSNGGEPVAGKIRASFNDEGSPVFTVIEGVSEVVVNAPDSNGFEVGKDYYAILLPTLLEKGFSMVYTRELQEAIFESNKTNIVSRSKFGVLAYLDVALEYRPTNIIVFEDIAAKYACVERFDVNDDGEVSFDEAEAATSLSGLFRDWNTVTSFDEIRYFTNVNSTWDVFNGLKYLKRIIIPDHIETVGQFTGCISLNKVVLPNTISSIPSKCFQGCVELKDVNIPSSVSTIPDYCFYGCSSLEELDLPPTVTSIGNSAFKDCILLKSIGSIESLTRIGTYAFSGCSSLTDIVLPSGITSLPTGVFQNCCNLVSIIWPDCLTSIGLYSFDGCRFKNSDCTLRLPKSVKTIGSKAIGKVRHVIIPSDSAVSILADSFDQEYTLLYVPHEMLDMYKARSYWNNYRLFSIEDYPVEPSEQFGEAVDLGLSVKWSSFNIGASSPNDFGYYFSWGEDERKTKYTWDTYEWCSGPSNFLTKYNSDADYGRVDNRTSIDLADDAAHIIWGDLWRLPSVYEMEELITKCTWTWQNYGMLVTGPNGNSIFLLASGFVEGSSSYWPLNLSYYWTSSISSSSPIYAMMLSFSQAGSSNGGSITSGLRYNGRPIRPVYGAVVHVESISLEETFGNLGVGESLGLKASIEPENACEKAITWHSSNESVAKVRRGFQMDTGIVIGVSVGSATITATTVDGGLTACFTVTVTNESTIQDDMMDLGLSVKWAKCNIGAISPEDFGHYYAWGEVETKLDYSWASYKWCMGSATTLTKYCSNPSEGFKGFTDYRKVLDFDDDAACETLGNKWRMPTMEEYKELVRMCSYESVNKNGVEGYQFTGPNGNSIFFPSAGYRNGTDLITSEAARYWTSSASWGVDISSSGVSYAYANGERCYGRPIRPVSD